MQDEIVRFADFSIEENPSSLSVKDLELNSENIFLIPNPATNSVILKNANLDNYNKVQVFNTLGKLLITKGEIKNSTLDVSSLTKGLYFIVLKKNTTTTKVLKCYIK